MKRLFEMRARLQTLFYLFLVGLFAACESNPDIEGSGTNDDNSESNGTGSSSTTYASSISDITSFDINIDKTELKESETIPSDNEDYIENNTFKNEVSIAFNGNSASVTGDVDGVSMLVNGADVIVTSSAKKVVYTVSGTTTDGFLKIYSDNKYELKLNGVNITNPNGAPINLQSKKRAYIVLADGTENTITDGSSYTDATEDEDMKATFFGEGKMLFSGSGKLNVYANCKAAIRSDDYVMFRPGNNIYIKATAGNGIKANDAIYIKGGVLNIETSATAAKAISSDGLIQIDGGRTTALTTGGGELDDDGADVSASAAVKADSNFVMNGGSLLCKSTGAGGKGISTDQTFTINDGCIRVITTGKQYVYGSLDTSPKGIKSDEAMYINGGDIMVRCTGGEGSEGIESKSTMDITGGTIRAYCYDDAINSSKAMTISGGSVFAMGTNNDGIDSNSTLTISGGLVIACGTTVPEAGFDCDENTFAVTGGTLIGLGGTTSTPTTNSTTQPVAIIGGNGLSSGTFVTMASSDGSSIIALKAPCDYTVQGYTLLVSSPNMTKGDTYTVSTGASVSGDTEFCGYVQDATVSGGKSLASLTLSSIVTTYNNSGGQGGGPGGRN